MSNRIRTIFIGTADFAVPSLRALSASADFAVAGVITQPDKPAGRKQALAPPPVKIEALKLGLPVFQPEKIKGFRLPDPGLQLVVVVAYSQLIPEEILGSPRYGVLNVHGSLLPAYRGAACVQWPIINGERETGVTIIKMDKGLDTGPIIAQKSLRIEHDDTAGSLSRKLSMLGAEILLPAARDYVAGRIKPSEQDHGRSSYVKRIEKADARIDWGKPAENVERFIRGMQPWPGAWSQLTVNGRPLRIKFFKSRLADPAGTKRAIGEIFSLDNKLCVQCLDQALVIDELQIEGKKLLRADEFLRGNQAALGLSLI